MGRGGAAVSENCGCRLRVVQGQEKLNCVGKAGRVEQEKRALIQQEKHKRHQEETVLNS